MGPVAVEPRVQSSAICMTATERSKGSRQSESQEAVCQPACDGSIRGSKFLPKASKLAKIRSQGVPSAPANSLKT